MARRKGRFTKERIVEMYKMYSVNSIADMDGTTYGCIIRILHEAGVEMRSRGNNEVRVAPITHGYCQVAAQVGMTPYRYVRLAAIVKMGGVCTECGEDDLRVLDINHVNGKGKRKGTAARYAECCNVLNQKKPPKNLNILCCNCNRRHEFDRGNIPPIPENFYALASTH